jgi:hypothetical protein
MHFPDNFFPDIAVNVIFGWYKGTTTPTTKPNPLLQQRKTDDILRTLLLMHDGVSFDKIQPKQVG